MRFVLHHSVSSICNATHLHHFLFVWFALNSHVTDICQYFIYCKVPACRTDRSIFQKSLEGFYQESGRAGRDGKDSDCILYYRPQDASHISAVTTSEKEGQTKRMSFPETLGPLLTEGHVPEMKKYSSCNARICRESR